MLRSILMVAIMSGLLAMALRSPFIGILMFSWVSFMNPHQMVYGFANTLPWAMLIFLVTVVGCFVAKEPTYIPINGVTISLLIFLIFITITSFVAAGPQEAVWHYWDRISKMIVGTLLLAALLDTRWRIQAIIWIMVISVGWFGIRGGIFTLTTGGGNNVLGPPNTIIFDRNHLAVATLITVPLMNYLRLQSQHAIVRLGLAAAIVLSLISAIGSNSRGALVSFIGMAAVMWYRSKSKIMTLVLFSIFAASMLSFMPDSWKERMMGMEHYQEDGSAMGRVRIWMVAWQIGLRNPLTGAGFRAMHYPYIVDQYAPGIPARATHSIWFEVIGEHGFLGFGIWLTIILFGIYYSFRISSMRSLPSSMVWAHDFARMSQISIVTYMLGGTFLSLSYWDFFWAILIINAATYRLIMLESRQPRAVQRTLAPATAAPAE